MEAYKLYRILERSEKSAFKKLFKSKLTGDVGKLFEIFERHKEDNIESDYLAEQMGKKEGVINNTASKLNKYIEDFIIYDEIANQNDSEAKTQRELLLLNYLRKKPEGEEITGLFKIRATRLERKFDNIKKRDAFYYVNLYKLRHYLYHAMSIDRWKSEEAKPKITDILSAIDSLFTVIKLFYGAESRVRNNMLGEETSLAMLDEAYQLSKYPHIDDTAALLTHIYRLLLDAFQYADTKSLTHIKDTIIESSPHIGRYEMAGMFTILLHHIARAVRTGDTGVYQVGYEVLKYGLEHDCFVVESILNHRILLDYVTCGNRIGKTAEIKTALKAYGEKLHPDKRDSALAVCRAYCFYSEKLYFEAYEELNNIKRGVERTPSLIAHIKILKIKSLYECTTDKYEGKYPEDMLRFREIAKSFIDFFIERRGEKAKPYTRFIQILIKLEDVNTSKKDLQELINSEAYEQVYDKAFLKEKIAEKR